MNEMAELERTLCHEIARAAREGRALAPAGGGSKAFYGREVAAEPLPVTGLRGIVEYQPSELVFTARAGTPLAEIEAALAEQGQILPFEPPHLGPGATLGGTVACGLSGPRRPHAGAVRDFALGVRCINGRGELLRFGGQVMKNVAGFDLPRLLTGSLGTLAVLVEVSLKVLPAPAVEWAGRLEATPEEALDLAAAWGRRPLPLSAVAWEGGVLRYRLSGNASAVAAARRSLGGEEEDPAWFQELREQRLAFFESPEPLWRLSLPPTAPLPALEGSWLLDWAGAQRWLVSGEEPKRVFAQAALAGGHASLFRGGDRRGRVFQPPPGALLGLQRRLRRAFDPAGILNPGKIHDGL